MTLLDIRNEAWEVARDTLAGSMVDGDRLWPSAEMNRYINRTYRKIARDTRCIRDASTPAVCQIAVAPIDYTTYQVGTLDYQWANTLGSWMYHLNVAPYLLPLHPSIIDIDEVKWTTQYWKLTHVSVTKWQPNTIWEQVIGMPTEFATDLQANMIALNYRATTTDTLRLSVKRMPLVDLSADGDIPEFRSEYHDFILAGVLEQMYSKQDIECFDGKKAAEYKAEFLDNIDQIKKQERILNQHLNVNVSLNAFR